MTQGLFALVLFMASPSTELPNAQELLSKSIQFHDAKQQWADFAHELKLRETRPNGSDRHLTVALDLPKETFIYTMDQDGQKIFKKLEKEACEASLNGKTTFTEEETAKWRLSCDAIKRYYHYYLYLYGLPMKLKDPGTIIDPTVKQERFNGKDVWAIKVTYSEAVGKDIWYFYFLPETAELVGCRFYHDEAANDGEYIFFEDTYQLDGMKIPKNRTWYTNKDDRLLGSDHLEGHQ